MGIYCNFVVLEFHSMDDSVLVPCRFSFRNSIGSQHTYSFMSLVFQRLVIC